MSTEVLQVFQTPDGKSFNSKAEALDHIRRPKIMTALLVVTENNTDLSNWLIDNQETVVSAFDTGTIRRVSKSEKNKLDKAADYIVEFAKTNQEFAKKAGFVVDHADEMKESFRWPKVKRMTPEEKAVAAKNTLVAASDGNEQLADWAIANEKAILEAFDAGKEKRQVSPKATSGLAAYRHGKTVEKEALEAGKSPEEAAEMGKKAAEEMKAATAPVEAPSAPTATTNDGEEAAA